MKNFILIGAGGYIAPRHMKAIRDTGNNLLAALDKHDSVGVLDTYFPHAEFFTEFERFDRHIEKLKRSGTSIDYVCVCTPNYLHDAHIRFGLRIGASVICEKPVVLNPWNLEALLQMEPESKGNVYGLLQMRYHPAILQLKGLVDAAAPGTQHEVELQYISSRGSWYNHSWKGDVQKSGGIATNIGIHFFDMLQWIFGPLKSSSVKYQDERSAAGELIFNQANVNWLLSIDEQYLPAAAKAAGQRTWRNLQINGRSIDFSDGTDDLHTKAYESILKGEGISLKECLPAIEIAHGIRKG